MANYKFELQRWHERNKQQACPACHRGNGCFKEYVWVDTRQPVDNVNHTCGKCDHENTCGYHMTPAEFLKDNPDGRRSDVAVPEQRQMKRIEMSRDQVAATMTAYETNVFVKWLYSLPWNDEQYKCIDKVLFLYCVGTARNGGTIYWQVDEHGIIRGGKIMQYKADGHRDKKYITWAHSKLKPCPNGPRVCKSCYNRSQCAYPEDEYQLVQCLFGQHLLCNADNDTTIHLVESEKAAIIMAIVDEGFGRGNLWMACGGLKNLNAAKIQPLGRHKVIIYPDTNGVGEWGKKMSECTNVTIATEWMKLVTDEDPPGAGIDDIILRRLSATPRARLEEMKKRNPNLSKLIENLKLELDERR